MSRRRQEYRAYARAYLGVRRLPAGVPERLDDIARRAKASGISPSGRDLGQVLNYWRRIPFLP